MHGKQCTSVPKQPMPCVGAFNSTQSSAFDAATTSCLVPASYDVSVLKHPWPGCSKCLALANESKPCELTSAQGWHAGIIHAVRLEGSMPGQRWTNAQSRQRCSYYVCESLSAQARTHGSALPDPLMRPWDHGPPHRHLSTHGH